MVRDGITQITKLEFLGFIQQIRKQAFKESIIRSAFEKTGIIPFNPSIILEKLRDRRAITPPDQTASQSSPFSTPLTIRLLNRLGDHILETLPDDLDINLTHKIEKFIYGAQAQATQLIQIKEDLSRTKLAESARQMARAEKNRQL